MGRKKKGIGMSIDEGVYVVVVLVVVSGFFFFLYEFVMRWELG